MRQQAPGQAGRALTVNVTSAADRGPGTLREALFIVASANGNAEVAFKVRNLALGTLLPPLVNPHGVRIVARHAGGTEIDARALSGGPVFDVAGANTSLEGLHGAQLSGDGDPAARQRSFGCVEQHRVLRRGRRRGGERQRRADRAQPLRATIASACASRPRARNSVVVGNEFANDNGRGPVGGARASPMRAAAPSACARTTSTPIAAGVVAANVAILVERNDFSDDAEARSISSVPAPWCAAIASAAVLAWASSPRTPARRSSTTTSSITCRLRHHGARLGQHTAAREPGAQLRLRPGVRARRSAQPEHRGRQHHHRAAVQRHRRHRRFADPAPQSGAAAACAARCT